ncbi:helix-turn-helix domain-containing protein [uncultured Cellulomonas sp.]|uniref:helix-turn-helix domain-containing protein n=1 Tax=uncultured Cellulomonas sp. TaxID=189682 RepID=UPI0028EEACE2|nr:helix-turn-helix domain-containing protein [uncultured Cellulomonas sp.]
MTGKLLGVDDAAARLGADPRTVRRWADTGRLPAEHTAGGHRRFRPTDIDAALRDDPVEPSSEAGHNESSVPFGYRRTLR